MFCERRSAKCSIPAPTVWLVIRSIRMKPPVSRLSAYGSNGTARSMATLQTPISLSSRRLAARCSSVLTLIRYFGSARVALSVSAPIFSR